MKININKQNKNIHKKEQIYYYQQHDLSYICTHCQQIITFENEILENITVTCPNCGRTGIVQPLQKQQNIDETNKSNHFIENVSLTPERKDIKIPTIEVKLLGILLIIIGIILYFILKVIPINASLALIIIGAIIFTFIPNNRLLFIRLLKINNNGKSKKEINPRNSSLPGNIYNFINKQFDISEKIAIALILWITLIYMITNVSNYDIFLILVYLGVLIMKIFSNELIPIQLKQRMNLFTIIFLFIFIIIIIHRLINIGIL